MLIVRARLAEADLDAIWSWIANQDVAAANRTIRRISETSERLRDFPATGRARDDIASGLRSLSAWPYVIFYRIAVDRIRIMRIIHGAQDLTALHGLD